MDSVIFSNFFMLTLVSRIDGTFPEPLSLESDPNYTLDISIRFTNKPLNSKMKLKISADVKEQKYNVRTNDGRTFRRVSNGRM